MSSSSLLFRLRFAWLMLCLPIFSNAQLATPVLISPVHQATNQPSSLTLKWHAVAGADQYMVEVIRDMS